MLLLAASPCLHTLTNSAIHAVRIQTLQRHLLRESQLPEREAGNLTTFSAQVKIKYVLALPPLPLHHLAAQPEIKKLGTV
jgi:hypothetical protein